MLKRTFYTLLLTLFSVGVFAQQDALFTQYMFNNLYITPAFAGVEGVTKLTAIHRTQWQSYQANFDKGGAPSTQMVNFTTPMFKLRSGFGAYVMNDRLGPQNNLEIQGMYAYHIGIKDAKLSLALKAGIYSQTINAKEYRAIHPNDPIIPEGKASQIRPDLGLGAFFRAEKYYVGVGVNHLLQSEFDFGIDSSRNALATHLNGTAGYFYEMNFDVKVQFSTAVRTDFNKTQFDLSGIAYYKDKLWGGLAFRQAEAASLLLGYAFLKEKSLRLGSSFDFVLIDKDAKQFLSWELMLSYELPVNPGSGKKVVRTPRYRH
ncbi:MAG TPA: type IX secretion system membrane protein PorP/SprF [Chryseolinea sp.]|nr:type IX secretion system membrane protein PorP/SprF [Chryseolinea sp.]